MKLFDANAACPKCGGDDIHSAWQDKKDCGVSTCTWESHRHPERIKRLCRRCQYAWYEKPLPVEAS
jgi:ssDNA-binding Zn-finger/Zn-ribbon topoisomerase 1